MSHDVLSLDSIAGVVTKIAKLVLISLNDAYASNITNQQHSKALLILKQNDQNTGNAINSIKLPAVRTCRLAAKIKL